MHGMLHFCNMPASQYPHPHTEAKTDNGMGSRPSFVQTFDTCLTVVANSCNVWHQAMCRRQIACANKAENTCRAKNTCRGRQLPVMVRLGVALGLLYLRFSPPTPHLPNASPSAALTKFSMPSHAPPPPLAPFACRTEAPGW